MLVLLVIFMIATPMLSRAISYRIPQSGPDSIKIAPREPINLRIDDFGGVWLDGQPASLTDLRPMLAVRAGTDPMRQPPLWIDAADDSDYDTVARVLAAANAAHLARVGFLRH